MYRSENNKQVDPYNRPLTTSSSVNNFKGFRSTQNKSGNQANVSEKYQTTKVTVEQVYIQRMSKSQSSNLKSHSKTLGQFSSHLKQSDESFEQNTKEQHQIEFRKQIASKIQDQPKYPNIPFKQFYYSHINEIRSIKEFMYMIEKLKRKNIEKKMMERVQLRHKLLKIKEIEVWKKLQYYLEKRIRQFLKEFEHAENSNLRSFEAFKEQCDVDPQMKNFDPNKMRTEFTRCQSTLNLQKEVSFEKGEYKKSKSKSVDLRQDLEATPTSPSKLSAQKGTSKLLTMKVADKLLSLMLVEESKFKRIPLGGHIADKRQELQTQLNKPFGGKMNFTPNSFTWLIENTLERTTRQQSLLKTKQFQIKKQDGLKGGPKEQLFQVEEVPYPPMGVIKCIDQRLQGIDKIMASKNTKKFNIKPIKHLKNRRIVSAQFEIHHRIKENVQFQRERNQMNWKYFQGKERMDAAFAKNDQYVNLYI